jgi:hypothetical protein
VARRRLQGLWTGAYFVTPRSGIGVLSASNGSAFEF